MCCRSRSDRASNSTTGPVRSPPTAPRLSASDSRSPSSTSPRLHSMSTIPATSPTSRWKDPDDACRSARAVQRACGRRSSRRHRVRVRRHACEVGRRRRRDPSSDLHRRVQRDVGCRCRHRRPHRSPAGRTTRGRPSYPPRRPGALPRRSRRRTREHGRASRAGRPGDP